MENPGFRFVGIIVINLICWAILRFTRRAVPALGKRGDTGLYMILLPLGFGLWGFDLPYWSTVPIVLIGLAELLYTFRQALVWEGRVNAR